MYIVLTVLLGWKVTFANLPVVQKSTDCRHIDKVIVSVLFLHSGFCFPMSCCLTVTIANTEDAWKWMSSNKLVVFNTGCTLLSLSLTWRHPPPPSPSGRSVKARGPQFLEPFTAVNRTWESPMWLSPRHAHTYKLFAVIWQQAAAWILCRLPLSLLHAHTYTHMHKPNRTSWFLLFFWWEGGLFVPFPHFTMSSLLSTLM